MEEEKKNNKGLMVGIIIFLIICLVAIFYFMFKMTYVGEKKSQSNENNNAETTETNQGIFTELIKYELQEGEEKEIKGNKIKREHNKYYLNEKEIDKSLVTLYSTNNLIIIAHTGGQYGFKYNFYNLEGKEINSENDPNMSYSYLEMSGGRLYASGYNSKYGHNGDFITLNNLAIATCGGPEGFTTSIDKYKEQIQAYENEDIQSRYEIKLEKDKVIYEYLNSIYKVKDFLNEHTNLCVEEKTN